MTSSRSVRARCTLCFSVLVSPEQGRPDPNPGRFRIGAGTRHRRLRFCDAALVPVEQGQGNADFGDRCDVVGCIDMPQTHARAEGRPAAGFSELEFGLGNSLLREKTHHSWVVFESLLESVEGRGFHDAQEFSTNACERGPDFAPLRR